MQILLNRKNLLIFSFIVLIATGLSCGSSRRSIAIEEGWDLLGESKANFVRDKDAIQVHSNSRYTAIRFKVEEREIKLSDLKVVYMNGDKLEPSIEEVIPADQTSRIIELGLEGKNISQIEFRYRTTGSLLKGQAKILVFGRRYPGY